MPIYSYFCKECDREEEIIHKMDDNIPRMCRVCNKQMDKQLTPPKGIRITEPARNSATGQVVQGPKKMVTQTYYPLGGKGK